MELYQIWFCNLCYSETALCKLNNIHTIIHKCWFLGPMSSHISFRSFQNELLSEFRYTYKRLKTGTMTNVKFWKVVSLNSGPILSILYFLNSMSRQEWKRMKTFFLSDCLRKNKWICNTHHRVLTKHVLTYFFLEIFEHSVMPSTVVCSLCM